MAIARLKECEVEDRGTPNYDGVAEKVGVDEDPPAGLIVHCATFNGSGVFGDL